jgi:hypothetical protein
MAPKAEAHPAASALQSRGIPKIAVATALPLPKHNVARKYGLFQHLKKKLDAFPIYLDLASVQERILP